MFSNSLYKLTSRSKLLSRFKSAVSIQQQQEGHAVATATQSVPVSNALIAAAAGILTVSGAAAVVERSTASTVPKFHPKGQRFSQDSFGGRFAKMLLACDPSLLLYSESQVRVYRELLESYETQPPEMARALWEAKRIYDSAVHPDTGELIPRPFRMSGYVPYNGPICVAMVASQSTIPLLFWSWANQSQNALVNFYNRNASSPMTNETLMKSYGAAVTSALAVAFGLCTIIKKRYSPEKAKTLLQWVAFPSAIVASSLNCFIVRSPELSTGIPLMDCRGKTVGGENDSSPLTSLEAARRGVYSTTASRALLQAPVYLLPPLLLSTGILKRYLSRYPAAAVPMTTYLLLVSFGVGLPATVAIFPQVSEIKRDDVEAKFQQLRDPETEKQYPVFYYNKGL
jgi:sideroflexin-5